VLIAASLLQIFEEPCICLEFKGLLILKKMMAIYIYCLHQVCKGNLKLGARCGTSRGIQSIDIGNKYRSGNTMHLAGESEEKKGWRLPR
jgi:hypothetical protein